MSQSKEEAVQMLKIAYEALDSKQGEDIKVLDIREVTVLADYFIIAHGNNKNHLQSLIDETERLLSKSGFKPKQIEGYRTDSWILLDYGNIIIHIFGKDDRLFYDLERIWNDGKEVNVQSL